MPTSSLSNRQCEKDKRPAEVHVSHWKLDRNVDSDEAALTEEGKPFHALDAATGKARSPSVERFVGATTNVSDGRA